MGDPASLNDVRSRLMQGDISALPDGFSAKCKVFDIPNPRFGLSTVHVTECKMELPLPEAVKEDAERAGLKSFIEFYSQSEFFGSASLLIYQGPVQIVGGLWKWAIVADGDLNGSIKTTTDAIILGDISTNFPQSKKDELGRDNIDDIDTHYDGGTLYEYKPDNDTAVILLGEDTEQAEYRFKNRDYAVSYVGYGDGTNKYEHWEVKLCKDDALYVEYNKVMWNIDIPLILDAGENTLKAALKTVGFVE